MMNVLRNVVIAALLFAGAAAAETPELRIVDPLKFQIDGKPFSFIVFAANGPVQDLSVVVRDLKDPQQKAAGTSVFTIEYESHTVDPLGTRITVKAPVSAFPLFGDYNATLVLNGKGAKTLTALATLTRPKPEVGAPGLKDNAVVLQRRGPGAIAGLVQRIDVENRGAATLPGTVISGGVVVEDGDPKRVSPGQVKPLMIPKRGGGHGGFTLEPGVTSIDVEFTGFDKAGTFNTRLWVRAMPEAPPEEIPFKIIVTDHWFWPLLVIALGVAFALLVTYLAQQARPREENRLASLELRETLAAMRSSTIDAARLAEIAALEERLRKYDRDIEGGVAATAIATGLTALSTEVAALQKALAEDRRDVRRSLEAAEERLTSLEAIVEAADKDRLQALRGRLATARERLDSTDYGRAKAVIDEVVKQMPQIRLAVAATDERTRRGGRPEEVQAAVPEGTIVITEPASAWVSGRELTFQVSTTVQGGPDRYFWDFGDGLTGEGQRIRHGYRLPGNYVVTVSIRQGETELAKVVKEIRIDLSQIEQARAVLSTRRANIDLTLAAISLIVASVTGLWLLYAGRVFGTTANYLEAFVWGFGIDNSVRGLAAVMKKLT